MARPRQKYDPAAAGGEEAEIADFNRTAARLVARASGFAPEAIDAMSDTEIRKLAEEQPDHDPFARRALEFLDLAEGRP